MAIHYKLSARDTVTAAMFFWTSTSPDATDYPGPNAAEELTRIAQHGTIGATLAPIQTNTVIMNSSGSEANPVARPPNDQRFENGSKVTKAAPFPDVASMRTELTGGTALTHITGSDGRSWEKLTGGSYTDNVGTIVTASGGTESECWSCIFDGPVYPEWFADGVGTGSDDSAAFTAAFAASDVVALDGAKTYIASFTIIQQTLIGNNAIINPPAEDAVAITVGSSADLTRMTRISNLRIRTGGHNNEGGIRVENAVNTHCDHVVQMDIDRPWELESPIFFTATDCHARRFEHGLRIVNQSDIGWSNVISFIDCHFDEGTSWLQQQNIHTTFPQGSVRFVRVTVQFAKMLGVIECAGSVGLITDTTFENFYSENCAEVLADIPSAVNGITVDSPCSLQIRGKSQVAFIRGKHLHNPDDAQAYPYIRALSGAHVVLDSPMGPASYRGQLLECDGTSSGDIKGQAFLDGLNYKRVSLDRIAPWATGTRFSAVEVLPSTVREVVGFPNKHALISGGNPWMPDMSAGDPQSVGTDLDPQYGVVSTATYDTVVGSLVSNRSVIPLWPGGAATVGRIYAASFLIRVASGTSQIRAYTGFGDTNIEATASATTEWQRVVMIAPASSTGSDNGLYIYPVDTTGPTVHMTALQTWFGDDLREFDDLLRGTVTARPYVHTSSHTVNPPEILSGRSHTGTPQSLVGARPGDQVIATTEDDIQGMTLSARCTSNDLAAYTLTNGTAASIDLTSFTVSFRLPRR